MPNVFFVGRQKTSEDGDKGGGERADNKQLKNRVGNDKGSVIDVKKSRFGGKKVGDEETGTKESQKSR